MSWKAHYHGKAFIDSSELCIYFQYFIYITCSEIGILTYFQVHSWTRHIWHGNGSSPHTSLDASVSLTGSEHHFMPTSTDANHIAIMLSEQNLTNDSWSHWDWWYYFVAGFHWICIGVNEFVIIFLSGFVRVVISFFEILKIRRFNGMFYIFHFSYNYMIFVCIFIVVCMVGCHMGDTSWASHQIRKVAGCACAGNARNVFPTTDFQNKLLVSDPGMHHGTC